MATDLSSLEAPWDVGVATMDATPGNIEAVTLPSWTKRVTVRFMQQDDATSDSGKLEKNGTDGAAIGANAFPIATGAVYSWAVTSSVMVGQGGVIYLAGGTASGIAHIMCEEAIE